MPRIWSVDSACCFFFSRCASIAFVYASALCKIAVVVWFWSFLYPHLSGVRTRDILISNHTLSRPTKPSPTFQHLGKLYFMQLIHLFFESLPGIYFVLLHHHLSATIGTRDINQWEQIRPVTSYTVFVVYVLHTTGYWLVWWKADRLPKTSTPSSGLLWSWSSSTD